MAKLKLQKPVELLLSTIFEAMHEKKAEHILCLDLSQIKGTNFDTFVICHGNSTTQVNAIAEEVRRKVKTICQQNPIHAEGFSNAEWILLDYSDVVVHVFQNEVREHYQLEHLWADAVITSIDDEPTKKTTKEPATKPVKEPVKKTVKTDESKSLKPSARKSTTRGASDSKLQSKRTATTQSATKAKAKAKPKSTTKSKI